MTSRFGELEVGEKDMITLKEEILGFSQYKRFFIVDPGDRSLMLWLQFADDGRTAFPILEPQIFLSSYHLNLLPAERASLEIKDRKEISVYTIVTIPQRVQETSANLKAPIVINSATRWARQIVLQDNKLEVRYPIYRELKKNLSGISSHDGKPVSNKNTIVVKPGIRESFLSPSSTD